MMNLSQNSLSSEGCVTRETELICLTFTAEPTQNLLRSRLENLAKGLPLHIADDTIALTYRIQSEETHWKKLVTLLH